MSEFDHYDIEDQPHPEIQSRYRRQLWLEILLPMLIGGAVVLGGAYWLGRSGLGTASSWADAALALMLVLLLVLALLPLALLIALAYGVGWLTGRVSPPLRKVRVAVYRASLSAKRAANLAAEPFIMARSARAAARQALRGLGEIARLNRVR